MCRMIGAHLGNRGSLNGESLTSSTRVVSSRVRRIGGCELARMVARAGFVRRGRWRRRCCPALDRERQAPGVAPCAGWPPVRALCARRRPTLCPRSLARAADVGGIVGGRRRRHARRGRRRFRLACAGRKHLPAIRSRRRRLRVAERGVCHGRSRNARVPQGSRPARLLSRAPADPATGSAVVAPRVQPDSAPPRLSRVAV